MLRKASSLFVCLIVASPLAAGPPPEEAVPAADPGANVQVSITVSGLEGGTASPRTYRLVAVDGGARATLFTGSRVPIPATTFQSAGQGSEVVPYTSYVYQNVGFEARVRARVLSDGRIHLDAEIEDSFVDAAASGKWGRPFIDARSQQMSAVVESGVPMEITRLDDRTPRAAVLEIRADVLK